MRPCHTPFADSGWRLLDTPLICTVCIRTQKRPVYQHSIYLGLQKLMSHVGAHALVQILGSFGKVKRATQFLSEPKSWLDFPPIHTNDNVCVYIYICIYNLLGLDLKPLASMALLLGGPGQLKPDHDCT